MLLGFLIQLFLSGTNLARKRAGLYEQILHLWQHREGREDAHLVAEDIARRSIDVIGWHLQESYLGDISNGEHRLVDQLGSTLSGELGLATLAAKAKARECLAFWVERGVLEYITLANEGSYHFVHRSLGEYAAARYVASLSEDERIAWLDRVHLDARWREVILLVAGIGPADWLIGHLLTRDASGDPVATETLLAASAVGEASSVSAELINDLAQRLTSRLASSIPHVAYEAADAYLALAQFSPATMASIVAPLIRHPQVWTRLTSLRLLLETDDAYVDEEAVDDFLREIPAGQVRGLSVVASEQWNYWNKVAQSGANYLHRIGAEERIVTRLRGILDSGRISAETAGKFMALYAKIGRSDIVDEYRKKHYPNLDVYLSSRQELISANRAILESLSRVVSQSPRPEAAPRRMHTVGKVVECLGLPHLPLGAWLALSTPGRHDAVDAVLRGVMAALSIDERETAADITWGLEALSADSDGSWLNPLPRAPVEPEWQRAKNLGLKSFNLVAALGHPCRGIAIGAAHLLSAGAGDQDNWQLLQDVLEHGRDQELEMAAALAEDVWGPEALNRLLRRLESNITLGCRWVLRYLPELSGGHNDPRVQQVLVRFLTADDSRVALAAGETLLERDRPAELLPVVEKVRAALAHWTVKGSLCERCAEYTTAGFCPKCHVAPLTPRASLLRLLISSGSIDTNELVDLASDRSTYVAEVAQEELKKRLLVDTDALRAAINRLRDEDANGRLLNVVFDLPTDTLVTVREELARLLDGSMGTLQVRIVASLGRGWLPREEATEMARRALANDRTAVRDAAFKALRSLQARANEPETQAAERATGK